MSDWQPSPVPDVAGTVQVYKDMRLGPGGLRSPSFNVTWRTKGPMTAECLRTPGYRFTLRGVAVPEKEEHTAPDDTCPCGFYGWYLPDVPELARTTYGMTEGILAVCEASGKIVPCTLGIRAQKMQLMGVYVEGGFSPEGMITAGMVPWADPPDLGELPVFTTRAELLEAFPPRDDVSQATGKTPEQMRDEWNARHGRALGSSTSQAVSMTYNQMVTPYSMSYTTVTVNGQMYGFSAPGTYQISVPAGSSSALYDVTIHADGTWAIAPVSTQPLYNPVTHHINIGGNYTTCNYCNRKNGAHTPTCVAGPHGNLRQEP